MSKKKYHLYSSEGCHLCEQALLLCQQAGIAKYVEVIDIVEDEKLVALYGICIPVLEKLTQQDHEKSPENNKLYWPFTVTDIEKLK